MKHLSIVIFLAACQASAAPSQPAQPAQGSAAPPIPSLTRNLVCERLALENSKAPCVPEENGDDSLHTHRARVTIDGQTIVCALNSQQVSVVCGPMFMPQQRAPEAEAPKAPAKK